MNRIARLTSCLALMLTAACSFAGAANIGNAIYGVYTETYEGMKYGTLNPFDADGAFMGAWQTAGQTQLETNVVVSTEGTNCLKVTVPASANGGVWTQFGYDGTFTPPTVPTNMTAYNGGSIEFMVKTNTEMTVKVEWGVNGGAERRINADLGIPLDNQWHYVNVPLSSFTGIDLAAITKPMGFHALWMASPPGSPRTYYVDNVKWLKNPLAFATVTPLGLTLKNVGVNSTAGQLTWSGVNIGSTKWKCAAQYMECKLMATNPSWGIQIYTDNKASDASPRYTGTGSAAGLVNENDTTKALPMCWRIVDVTTTTYTIAATADNQHLYSPEIGTNFYPWMYVKDRNDSGFANSDDYITAWDLRGIHYGEGEWGGAVSPNIIYFGADFSTASQPASYKTSKLKIELFYE